MEDALRIYELSESDDIQSGDVLLIDNSSLEQARKITPEVIVSKYAPTKEALETEIANREAADAALGESIDTKIAEAKSIIPVKHIVQVLPTENINTRDTYFVPAEEPNENNLYIEYAYINGTWEIIGSPVNIDLSDYYTKVETDDLISDKADASALNGYYTKDETDGLLNGKASASEIDTLEGAISAETQARESAVAGLQSSKADVSALQSYYTKTEADGLLDDKADTSAVSSETTARMAADAELKENKADKTALGSYYTKTETDGLLNGKADTSALGGYYTKAQTDDMLDGKADASALGSYYTKTEADGLLGAKASTSALSDETSARTAADTAINSTLTTHGNSISTLQSSVSAAEADIESLQEDIEAKADIPAITTPTGTAAELTDNTEARFTEVATLTLSLPSDTSGDYISSVAFTSGTTATSLSYPDTITMIGTDCIDGVFAPVANKRYTLIVVYDGAGLVGYVAGHEVTA